MAQEFISRQTEHIYTHFVFAREVTDNLARLAETEHLEPLNAKDYDKMISAWERALTTAIDTPCLFTQIKGLGKIVTFHDQIKKCYMDHHEPLVRRFIGIQMDRELAFFTEVYTKVHCQE